ncbi:MAG: hypothetical protein EXS55_03840 [Candidatus Magasanikbacteria bacterium]|nr:hypothetical protein [Candidatus Magasanikbacteria bacterium]
MSIERPENHHESRMEKEGALNLNIVSLNHCKTIDDMIGIVETASREGRVDTVILAEYNFKVDEVLAELKNIEALAKDQSVDIILAPDSHDMNWEEFQKRFQSEGRAVEKNDYNNRDSIGIFVGKNGLTFAFQKSWQSNPVHKIPNTSIGVTICAEIGIIKPKDLEGISILYNPSREADDPFLKFRMLQKYSNPPLTREAVARLLLEDEYYKALLDDSQYDPNDPEYVPELDTREGRERQFNEAVEKTLQKASDPKASIYVRKIEKALRERGIPVVRCDGPSCTGLLNPLSDVKIEGLEYKDAYTRFNLTKEK